MNAEAAREARVVVFLGPTLPAATARQHLSADYRPPAAQGDVLAAARERPWAIGLVDGYFHRVPAVWHKEILWAMSQGVHVFGGASMGALRAAELEAFGMEGVGRIFEDYHSGVLEDDDEVALIHGTDAAGFRPLSEPMVDLRATFKAALEAAILSPQSHDILVEAAKELHYPERVYPAILEAVHRRLPPEELDRFESWLPAGRVEQKRLDAIEMLRRIDQRRRAGAEAKSVSFTFHRTDAWAELERHRQREASCPTSAVDDAWLEEWKLEGASYAQGRSDAWNRLLAMELSDRDGGTVDEALLATAIAELCRRHGLRSAESLHAWREEQGIDLPELRRLMIDELRLRRVRKIYRSRLPEALEAEGRLAGRFRELSNRARRKQLMLERDAPKNAGLVEAGIEEEALWAWYFHDCLGRPQPADLETYARQLDFADRDALRRAVVGERLFLRALADSDEESDETSQDG